MISDSQALVHHLLALQLQTSDEAIDDVQRLDDLGLDPLDLVLFVLRLDQFAGGDEEFPLLGLDRAKTGRRLGALVELWGNANLAGFRETQGPRSRSAA
jgi:hypothetical protein